MKNTENYLMSIMETYETDGSPPAATAACEDNLKESDSVVNFQKFIYDLFDKNGILNDLRAYLRGHIIDVLRSLQTGEPPTCQKHFTQRLDLTYQALNMLIAEYLIRLDFSYSLSVFVSEIPLANMVFTFARNLMSTNKGDFEDLRFKDNDVWSILNYLGIKCDSEYATSILDLYYSKDMPLLLCVLKSMPLYQTLQKDSIDQANSISDRLSSCDLVDDCAKSAKCKHYMYCNSCQSRMQRLKEKYATKKRDLMKNTSEINQLNVESLMKDIGLIEKSLVDEMFQQMKGVYEAEVQMLKRDEESKIKRSIASHALQLQRTKNEMEESYKAREEELEKNVQEKKKFLWELARALRDQHANMSRAMHAVRNETDRLTAKEDSLKSQLREAEEILRNRGEDMRKQIANELIILDEHLQSMKRERENIHRERIELERLRASYKSNSTLKTNDSNHELKSHYDLLREELSILKNYLETAKLEPKCVIERSTLTDVNNTTSNHLVLNNVQDVDRTHLKDSEERWTSNKVVNDLKNKKNVNFCSRHELQSNVHEMYRDRRSPGVSEPGDVAESDLLHLREENERLKTFARQQREHIDELSSHQARLQAELTAARFQAASVPRPMTAPTHMPSSSFIERLNTSASVNSVGWRVGAGEEISRLSGAQPRVLLPGDALPFVGVLRDRHSDNRRYLINQWQALRHRMSPINGGKVRNSGTGPRERVPRDPKPDVVDSRPLLAAPVAAASRTQDDEEKCEELPQINETFTCQSYPQEQPAAVKDIKPSQPRDKSPKTLLKETKLKLRKKSRGKHSPPAAKREKSPTSVLREAKLRLRKLEIEAEAVEKSYMEFRRKQTAMKQERDVLPETSAAKDFVGSSGVKRSRSNIFEDFKVENVPRFNIANCQQDISKDFQKYLCAYQTKFSASASHFKTISSTNKSKLIPPVYSKIESECIEPQETRDNFLETPLTEFRKLYHTQKTPSPTLPIDIPIRSETPEKLYEPEKVSNSSKVNSARESTGSQSKSRSVKSIENELKILKENFSKMYNLQNNAEITQKIEGSLSKSESPKQTDELIEIIADRDVEEKSEANLEVTSPGSVMVVVERTVETKEIEVVHSGTERQQISTQMTLIVSPKRSVPEGIKESGEGSPQSNRSKSPDLSDISRVSRLSKKDVLDSIFHADSIKRQSSVELELNIDKDLSVDTVSDHNKGGEEYPDDFSADVDNCNSRSEYGDHTPISLPINSEDENFWDS